MAGEAAAVGANADSATHFAFAIEAAERLGTGEPDIGELRKRNQNLTALIPRTGK